MFETGSEITLYYPRWTDIQKIASSPRRERNIIVQEVRDLVSSPLTPVEFLRRPLLARSRWLVTGWDVDLKNTRQFYPGSTREFASPGMLRFALHRPGEGMKLIGHQFGPSMADRFQMIRLARKWIADRQRDAASGIIHPPDAPTLRVISTDLRLLS